MLDIHCLGTYRFDVRKGVAKCLTYLINICLTWHSLNDYIDKLSLVPRFSISAHSMTGGGSNVKLSCFFTMKLVFILYLSIFSLPVVKCNMRCIERVFLCEG